MPEVDLAPLHTFAMPAKASQLQVIRQPQELVQLAQNQNTDWDRVRILAGGSNSIFINDISGLILKIELRGKSLVAQTDQHLLVEAAAGENWDDFVAWTLTQNAFGLENLSLIPGSVGASPIQNIGAYGVEAGDLIQSVQVFNWKDGSFSWIDGCDCEFAYRDSRFKHDWRHLIIMKVRFKLNRTFEPRLEYAGLTAAATALELRQQVIELRRAKLPDPAITPNAGSFFHNPVIDQSLLEQLLQDYPQMPFYRVSETQCKIPAAWLLDQAGLKGQWYHEFGCYEKQPLVLIHDAQQQAPLSVKKQRFCFWVEQIQRLIREEFQIELKPEPVIA